MFIGKSEAKDLWWGKNIIESKTYWSKELNISVKRKKINIKHDKKADRVRLVSSIIVLFTDRNVCGFSFRAKFLKGKIRLLLDFNL